MIYFSRPPELPSSILNQFLWYNKYVQINRITLYFKRFSEHNVTFVMDLLDNSENFKP